MKILSCKYNWENGTVDIFLDDKRKISLLCEAAESEIVCSIEAKERLQDLRVTKPLEYAKMLLDGTAAEYCKSIDRTKNYGQSVLFRQYKERYPNMSDEQIFSLIRECQIYGS